MVVGGFGEGKQVNSYWLRKPCWGRAGLWNSRGDSTRKCPEGWAGSKEDSENSIFSFFLVQQQWVWVEHTLIPEYQPGVGQKPKIWHEFSLFWSLFWSSKTGNTEKSTFPLPSLWLSDILEIWQYFSIFGVDMSAWRKQFHRRFLIFVLLKPVQDETCWKKSHVLRCIQSNIVTLEKC